MDINTITQALTLAQSALELTETAVKKLNSAENLNDVPGLTGSFITGIVQKSANKASRAAENAVRELNACLGKIDGSDEIYMSADASQRLDDVLFPSSSSSNLANYTALRIRAQEAITALENTIHMLEEKKKQFTE